MSKDGNEETGPTMIIPRGTKIEVDPHGQLSIQAPGNLVIQNSGSYGTLESKGGSIRIDHNVEVEAVSVKASEACFVQGSLTAWKLAARSLQVEETAQAQIVLQETERLEIGRNARLVGNFQSEKELFLLFSRFAKQVRSLPFYFERKAPGELPEGAEDWRQGEGWEEVEGAGARVVVAEAEVGVIGEEEEEDVALERLEEEPPPARQELPEGLFFSLVLLERDAEREGYGPTSQRVLEELIKLLQERDLETLRHTHKTLFGRILEPREDVRRAQELIAEFFETAAEPPAEPPPAAEAEEGGIGEPA